MKKINVTSHLTDVFGEILKVQDIKNPYILNPDYVDPTEDKYNENLHKDIQKYIVNSVNAVFINVVVYSLMATLSNKKQTDENYDIELFTESVLTGKIAEKIVLASTTKSKIVELTDEEIQTISKCVSSFYKNKAVNYALHKLCSQD